MYLFTLILALLLSSCVNLPDPETTQDYTKDTVAIVTSDQSVGQTFISRRPRLSGIDLWFESEVPGMLSFELYHQMDDTTPVYVSNLSVRGGKTRLQIPIQDDPAYQTYYLRLSTDDGEISLLGRNEDAYTKGTAVINDQPIDADLAFRATYDYDTKSVWIDLRELLSIWWMILPLGILLFLPGWLLLERSAWKGDFDVGERTAISIGLSLSIIPLLMLWTSFVGLYWGRISVWVVVSILMVFAIWSWFKKPQGPILNPNDVNEGNSLIDDEPQTKNHTIESDLISRFSTLQSSFIFRKSAIILLISIFAITLFTRFAMVRDLAAPPWVDPIHHGLITRLMMETGGIPESYSPYLPTEADHYHFGFHSSLASFIWLTGLEIRQAALIFGQVLNALIVFAIYLLTKTLTQNRSTALAAALISGVFTLMPAYYASWGRYTQLAGFLILPVGIALIAKVIKTEDFSAITKTDWLLTSIICAGLFLVHYRVGAFLILLVIAYGLTQINPRKWLNAFGRLIIIALIAILLLLPWLPGMITDLLIPKAQAWSGGESSFSQIPWNFLKPGLGEAALVLAVIGLILGILLLKRFTITVLLWTGLIYLLANLGVLGLPGSGFVNPISMEITLFIPISILGGFAVGGILELIDRFFPSIWHPLPRLVFLALGIWGAILGAQRLIPTLNPVTFLAREADFPAIDWIRENIPEGETILINPTGWGYGLYMGNDGGYWISPLSGHQTLPPPVLYGLGKSEDVAEINQSIERLLPVGEDATALWDFMQSEEIRYVYTGVRGGIISSKALKESELFEVLYQEDGSSLFQSSDRSP